MRLISSKKSKRRIALVFIFAFMLSNLLSLFGPTAQAAVSISAPAAGTCFQHSGTVANGALVTVYNIGTIQISLTAAEVVPGQDTLATAGAGTANARATNAGSISTAGDVWGNVVLLNPPSGTNFVVVPGFQDTNAGTAANSANINPANATISNALSQDATNGVADQNLGISVGVVCAGTAGIGKAVIAIARDADSSTGVTAGAETYPKSGTGNNTVTISINGLGLAIPPSGDQALSGTLQATFEGAPSGITGGVSGSGNPGTYTVATAISGIANSTVNLCTLTSAAGQLEALLDADSDSAELYDKSGTSSANLAALGQIGSNTRVFIFDTGTVVGGVSGTTFVDTEPILIRGKAGTGSSTRDQVFATGSFNSDITSAGHTPNGSALDLTSFFSNSVVAPITITVTDDNASATTTLQAVDIILEHSTAAAAPTSLGYNVTQSSRHGFLGALRAAVFDNAQATTVDAFIDGSSWGVCSVASLPSEITGQECKHAAGLDNLAAIGGIAANGGVASALGEPFNDTFVDLKIQCTTSTNPVAGWFAIANSFATGVFSTGDAAQKIKASQAGHKFVVNSTTTLYTQALTNIAGSNPVTARSFGLASQAANTLTTTAGNAILYASCANNSLTLFPVLGGFDATRDIIAVTPKIAVTGISSTFSSDVNITAEVSGNNLTGTTTLDVAKLIGAASSGGTSAIVEAVGASVAENGQLATTCSSGGTGSVVLSGVTSSSIDTAISSSCTGGALQSPGALFTGGTASSVSGTTVVDGSPVVQGEARGILVREKTGKPTGFNELVNKVGGSAGGTVFEVSLPSGCDVIDDRDDNNTAVSATANAGGNDLTRISVLSTAGVTGAVSAGGTGDAALTDANVVAPASGATPAKLRFRISSTPGGAVDNATTDAILLVINSQDLFCPSTVTGDLKASVVAQNKVSSPTVTETLGSSVTIGSAVQALKVEFADEVSKSTKGEESTNTKIGATPRLSTGGVTTLHTLKITEGDAKAIPIGTRTSARNVDPDNTSSSTAITRGQIWIIPSAASAFSAAPAASDVTFSDTSLVVDGNPLFVSAASVDANAPLGSIIIGVKKNTATGAADPGVSTTTITVKNAKLAAATSTTTDLTLTVAFFSQDAGVVINTPGIAAGNNASTPTVFTPFAPASTKANTQQNGAGVQLGSGALSNSLLTSRATTLGAPQISPAAKVITSAMSVDASKVSVSSAAATASSGGTTTDNVVTVTGAAGAVDGGAEVVVSAGGTTTFDSVTVVASDDGSFVAKVRGDCASPATSVSVSVAGQVSGTKTNAITKTALCQGATGETEDSVFNEIAGSDGKVDISEVLSFVTAQGGLASIVTAGGGKLAGVIKAAKSALGLS